MKISVIICTHNPREDYLRRTLESLEKQTLPKNQWEFLLVDNASEVPLCDDWDLSWHPHGKHILESKLGLTPARIRGVRESKADLLLYVDDDNVLASDYLERTLEIASRMPFLGCFGAGRLEPEFEEEPAPELLCYTEMLALRVVDSPKWSNNPCDRWAPWGAGLVVTRYIAEKYVKVVESSDILLKLGRRGSALFSGEDDEFSWLACELGMGRGIFPELQSLHLINRERVKQDYLLKLARAMNYSGVMLSYMHNQKLTLARKTPSGWNVLKCLFTLKRSRFIDEGHEWWRWINKTPTKRAFERARINGIQDGLVFLEEYATSKANDS
jgi:glycosyltransferase involved in cell wall biosynthesis